MVVHMERGKQHEHSKHCRRSMVDNMSQHRASGQAGGQARRVVGASEDGISQATRSIFVPTATTATATAVTEATATTVTAAAKVAATKVAATATKLATAATRRTSLQMAATAVTESTATTCTAAANVAATNVAATFTKAAATATNVAAARRTVAIAGFCWYSWPTAGE